MDEEGLARRHFFKRGITKATQAGLDVLERRAQQKARHWIRPPFAKSELDFLLACTRCNACIEACPHQVIFPLPMSRGAEVAATPALDLVNKGCHLCEDWPCVNACGDKALAFSFEDIDELTNDNSDTDELEDNSDTDEPKDLLPPKLALLTINESTCLPYNGPECGACKGSCPLENALVWQNEKPTIDDAACIGCGLCREACLVEPKAITVIAITGSKCGV